MINKKSVLKTSRLSSGSFRVVANILIYVTRYIRTYYMMYGYILNYIKTLTNLKQKQTNFEINNYEYTS